MSRQVILTFKGTNREFGEFLRELRKRLNWGLALVAEAARPAETIEPRTLRTREAQQTPEATTSVAENGGRCK